jgi:1-deoxy-D-xylulose-5-phosphate reductoisomerase
MATRITILGATGSVGRAVLDVVAENPGRFAVEALVAGSDAEGLAALARSCGAQQAILQDEAGLATLQDAVSGTGILASAGNAAILDAAVGDVDIIISAITGTAGLAPTFAAIKAGRNVALANKESLVAAGPLIMKMARPGQILPLDSEHNALAQALGNHPVSDVAEMTLTASGGPFRTWSAQRIAAAGPRDALAHPNWTMGAKITIDSATMMNKGLELIEAHYLFGIESKRLGVLVHPQSIIHGLVAFRDGSVTAGLAVPDMRVPVAHCLGLGERLDAPHRRLDLARLAMLTFEAPDHLRFPALKLARDALEVGGIMPIVLNAANEIAVEAFLKGQINFGAITDSVAEMCALFAARSSTTSGLDDILAVDHDARRESRRALSRPIFAVN